MWMPWLLLACAGTADTDDSATPTLPAASTRWWHGGSRGHDPDKVSTEVPEEVWIRRVVDPAAGTIVEDIVQGGVWHVDYTVSGDQFAGDFVTADGTLAVTGTLYGEAWTWASWGSASTYMDGDYVGMYITSMDEIRSDGGLDTTKLVYTAEGDSVWQIDEASDPVDAADFDAALAAAGG